MADYFSTWSQRTPEHELQMKIKRSVPRGTLKHISQRMFHVEHFCGKMARLPL
jgi:hypothetical protein